LRRRVTIIGVNQARLGYAFLFQGPASLCKNCDFYNVCVENLESGRLYRIVDLGKKKLPCKLLQEEGLVVEVEESPVEVCLDRRLAIRDAIITFNPVSCGISDCENREKCIPVGLVAGDRCKVIESGQVVQCPEKLELVLASLLRVVSPQEA